MDFYKHILLLFIGTVLLPLSSDAQKQNDSIINYINALNYKYYQNINKNPTKSLNYAEEAFSYFRKIESNELKFKITTNFVTALFVNEFYDKALSVLDKIKSLEVQENNKALYHTLRGLVENDLNNILQAEEHYKKALQLYIKLKDKENEFAVLNNLGLLYNNIGDYKRSIELYLNCYEIINDLKVVANRYRYYMNIGVVNYNSNNYNSALGFFTDALQEASINSDSLRILKVHKKIAQTNVGLNKLGVAIYHYKKALLGYQKLKLQKEVCVVLLHLGDVYNLKNDVDTAFNYYNNSQKIASEYSFSQEDYLATLNLGVYYQNKLNFQKARLAYKRIIKNKTEIANLEILKKCFNGLYQIEKLDNNPLLSLAYLENYLKYDISTRERQLITLNEQIEIKYNLRQKEFEIDKLRTRYQLNNLRLENRKQQVYGLVIFAVLMTVVLVLILTSYFQKRKTQKLLHVQNEKLLLTNKEIKTNRKELAGLNKIKDQLLSIIAHDVKSPITDFHNLLSILRHNLDTFHKNELKKNLAAIESSSSNLLNLLNNILNWTISQSFGTKVKISTFSLNKLIDTNLKLVEGSIVAKELTVNFCHSKTINMFVSDFNILDFAIRNILSNAVKFTGKKGTIHIKLIKLSNAQIEIRVADSGVGFKEEIYSLLKNSAERVPITLGTNTEKGYGIGLSLCKNMLAKINSQIIYKKNKPCGSIFILQLNSIDKQL